MVLRYLVALNPQSGSRQRCLVYFLFVIQSGMPDHRAVLPTFRGGLPSLVKPFWKHLHRHTWRWTSVVIQNPVKLTVKINISVLLGYVMMIKLTGIKSLSQLHGSVREQCCVKHICHTSLYS